MHFRSVAQLNDAVVAWSRDLPRDIDLIVGIPRSGMLAATLLALHMDLRPADLDGLLRQDVFLGGKRTRMRHGATWEHALVVDDSVLTGGSIREARHKVEAAGISGRISFGAVYTGRRTRPGELDLAHEIVPAPRVFEWNVLSHDLLPRFCMDIDGVLCRDPLEDENDDGPRYEEFLDTVAARSVPGEQVGWLVTSRLERHRDRTEAWLAAQGVRYGELLMHPADTGAERRAAGDHAARKAEAYVRTGALLFIESEAQQAQQIARLSGKSVYCTDTRTMLQPPAWREWRRRLLDVPSTAPVVAADALRRAPNVPGRLRRELRDRRRLRTAADQAPPAQEHAPGPAR